MESPDKLNYDCPLLITAIQIDDDKLHIVSKSKLALEWCNIAAIEEYPKEYDELYDWGEFKGTNRCWIRFCGVTNIVLANFDELFKYWEYYLKNVRDVNEYQIPHKLRMNE